MVESAGLVRLLTRCASLMDLLIRKKPRSVCVRVSVCVGWRSGLGGNR